MHPWRFRRKGLEDVPPATEPHSDLPGSPDTPIHRALGLARVDETAAPTASEEMAVASVQLRDAPSAELAVSCAFWA
jgi:hypothetical protein